MLSRRDFIKALGVLGGAVLTPLQWFTKVQAAPAVDQPLPPGGEIYGQFLLLPEGAPIPNFVQDYKFGIPSMCGLVDETTPDPEKESHGKMNAVHVNLNSARDLSRNGGFPVFTLNRLPEGVAPAGAALLMHQTGEIFGGDVTFQAYDQQEGVWYTAIVISAQIDYPHPFPLWYSVNTEPDAPAVVLEKVDFTPGNHGILVRTQQGFALHWIHQGTYFLMTGDRMPGADVRDVASALVLDS